MNRDRVEQAMANLQLPEFSGICDVFGTVLQQRSTAQAPDCAWFDMLAKRVPVLESINSACSSYARLVSVSDARKKAEADLMGPARRSPYLGFQNCLGDFYAELAAITELSKLGYHQFRARHASSQGKAYDYDARLSEEQVCIEVKHLRPPRTLVDVFFDEVGRLAISEGEHYPFNLAIEYFYDNTVTAEQEERVLSFLASVRGRTAPFTDTITFADGTVAQVNARLGYCTAMRLGSRGVDDPETFNVDGLLNKVKEKAERACAQMSEADCRKVLVLNINTPWAELSLSHLHAAREIIGGISGGTLRPYFMLYYSLIRIDG